VGLDVDWALGFVASKIPNLRHFSLHAGKYYFGTSSLQLTGDLLKSVFEQKSVSLHSACIYFGDCVQDHTERILVD
jgi:hypothetical protein